MKRTMAVKLGGGITISANGGNEFQIKTVNGPKTRDRKFVIGENVEDEGADGSSVTVSINNKNTP